MGKILPSPVTELKPLSKSLPKFVGLQLCAVLDMEALSSPMHQPALLLSPADVWVLQVEEVADEVWRAEGTADPKPRSFA